MWLVAKKLALGVALIVASSTVLLLSDLKNRKGDVAHLPRIATLKYASRAAMDDALRGVMDGLAKAGYLPGRDFVHRPYDGQNDMAVASHIARAITDGRYDMVITASTPCLQAVANANAAGRTKHVFVAVTAPFESGVGLNAKDPTDHPAHLVGIGTFLPVGPLFRLVKERIRPDLKRVGAVYSGEACAEACLVKARKACKELGIELLAARVETTNEVYESAASLVNRGVEALWVGGDNTVETGVPAMVRVGLKGGVPVLTQTPAQVKDGVLLSLGADYYDVGVLAGELAARVLAGADMAKIPVEDVVPELLAVNLQTAGRLGPKWAIPSGVVRQAAVVIDADGKRRTQERVEGATTGREAPKPVRKWRLFFVNYMDIAATEEGVRGLQDGLKDAGLKQGRDFTVTVKSGQGDMATLKSIMDLAKTRKADMVLPICTPPLQAALRRFAKTPIVYSMVASGVKAGAGRSSADHRANVTGVDVTAAVDEMAELLPRCLPETKRVGTVFCPAETNSVFTRDLLRGALRRKGIELVTAPAHTPAEVSEALRSLSVRNVRAFCQISDNLSESCFASYLRTAERVGLPVFAFTTRYGEGGAVLATASDFYGNAREAGRLAARVIRGEDPADIPFGKTAKARLYINLLQAKRYGVRIPEGLRKRAHKVIE